MTLTEKPSPADQAPRTSRHRRGRWIAAAALVLAAGTGTGLAVALTGSPHRSTTSATGYPPGSMRDYYNSMMGRYGAGAGGMMGGGSGLSFSWAKLGPERPAWPSTSPKFEHSTRTSSCYRQPMSSALTTLS